MEWTSKKFANDSARVYGVYLCVFPSNLHQPLLPRGRGGGVRQHRAANTTHNRMTSIACHRHHQSLSKPTTTTTTTTITTSNRLRRRRPIVPCPSYSRPPSPTAIMKFLSVASLIVLATSASAFVPSVAPLRTWCVVVVVE